jgi:hypothetical protein
MAELTDTFVRALPDLTLVVRDDGVIVANLGGWHLGIAEFPGELVGTSISELWTQDIAARLSLLVRRTLRSRIPVDRRYQYRDRDYEVRVQPKGIDRVMMVLRDVTSRGSQAEALLNTDLSDVLVPEDRAAGSSARSSRICRCRVHCRANAGPHSRLSVDCATICWRCSSPASARALERPSWRTACGAAF